MGTRLLFLFKCWGRVGLELCPVNLAVFQVKQVDFTNGRLLVLQSVFGVLAPVVGGANNNTVRENLFAGCGEKAVNIAFIDLVGFSVELALNCVVLTRAASQGDEVNACVPLIETLLFGPVGIGPNLAIEIAVARFVAKVAEYQLFKVGALFAFRGGVQAVGIQ